jgi:hypothetical protein
MRKRVIGERFGMLVIVDRVRLGRKLLVRCKCDCGNTKDFELWYVETGKRASCGCIFKRHGMFGTPEYKAWQSMRSRCNAPGTRQYKNYGGRGIRVCESWSQSFDNFYRDMGNRPSDGHSLDRIDVNGNYEPSNCRWADSITQANNKRDTRYLTLNGETHSIAEWSRIIGVKQASISSRLFRGYSIEDALKSGLYPRQWERSRDKRKPRKTPRIYCVHGHPLAGANACIRDGRLACRNCDQAKQKRSRDRLRNSDARLAAAVEALKVTP